MMRRGFFGVCLALAGFVACENDSSTGDFTPTLDGGGLTGFDAATGDGAVVVDSGRDSSQPDAGGSDAGEQPASPGALSFNGANVVVFATPDGGPSETAFTEEVWFKTTTMLGNMVEVFNPSGGADRFLYTKDGTVCFYVYSPSTVCTTETTFNDGNWHHAAGTLGAAGGQKLYVDGVLKGTVATKLTSTFTGGNAIRVGYGFYGFSAGPVHFTGQIDEVRIWSVERSASEIEANYRRTIAANSAGLQGYWKFDETGSTTTAKDEVAGGHDGTLTGFTFTTSPWIGPGAF